MKFVLAAFIGVISAVRIQGDYFYARDIGRGTLDKKYERVPPAQFSGDGDDLFMKSMIMKYSMEGKTEVDGDKGGDPNGPFFMDEAATRAAATEVLGTHKGLKGDDLKDYVKTYFPRTLAHFDVNHTGVVGVEVMPQFMRFIASDQTLQF